MYESVINCNFVMSVLAIDYLHFRQISGPVIGLVGELVGRWPQLCTRPPSWGTNLGKIWEPSRKIWIRWLGEVWGSFPFKISPKD